MKRGGSSHRTARRRILILFSRRHLRVRGGSGGGGGGDRLTWGERHSGSRIPLSTRRKHQPLLSSSCSLLVSLSDKEDPVRRFTTSGCGTNIMAKIIHCRVARVRGLHKGVYFGALLLHLLGFGRGHGRRDNGRRRRRRHRGGLAHLLSRCALMHSYANTRDVYSGASRSRRTTRWPRPALLLLSIRVAPTRRRSAAAATTIGIGIGIGMMWKRTRRRRGGRNLT